MVYIVIVEPHPLLRLGLSTLMTGITPADRITAQDYHDLYQSPPHANRMDIALLAAHPDERINILIQAVRRAHAPKRVVLLSDTSSPPPSWINLPGLVAGYISKASGAETILSSIRSVVSYKNSSRLSVPPMLNAAHGSISPAIHPAPHSYGERDSDEELIQELDTNEAKMLGLSSRQYEVLVLLAQGHPVKLICRHLTISMATTKGHLEAIYQRLGAHNRSEAVFVALAQGAKLRMSNSPQSVISKSSVAPIAPCNEQTSLFPTFMQPLRASKRNAINE
ncbi:response regulator transcription factor [Eoetvoesiella caeni]|uniref:LuxR family two component transcriptional regulator n=1 Tax=Eoetvoesiella caeni TaxID=645616 RepID=A0A366HEJ6_9BURK|nr:response regulator transcription factor [Eoetvoesiella caeni]MCI2808564.1 response regulator transcription factor [Eoetvoesiella caeni]NYT55104.1 response regulator transcription factor [Eoetvoesiella caeni]RBP40916.1 LuxR family two component transcriptional regulator [Eoetvoesiella caeni]